VEKLTIGEVASRSGAPVSALRYYESLGLISSTRTGGGQRRFARDVLRRVAVIQAGQRVGLSLAQIQAAFAGLPADKAPTRRDWERVSRAWRSAIDSRIAEMTRIRDDLDGCIAAAACRCGGARSTTLTTPQQPRAQAPGSSDPRPPCRWAGSERSEERGRCRSLLVACC
jgi:MerR family redox-sensitive transcriptional activator SoxR